LQLEEMGQTPLAEPDDDGEEARIARPQQAAAAIARIDFGPSAGQKMPTLRGSMPRQTTARQPLCADIDGFSLDAAVQMEAHDRERLEQSWRDRTTHSVMGPLAFVRRQAELVPRPHPAMTAPQQ
jgi:hypothetical protein